MLVSVARRFRWEPEKLGSLFFDTEDYLGLVFWYDTLLEEEAEIKRSSPKKK